MKNDLTITFPLEEYDRLIIDREHLRQKVDELESYIRNMPIWPVPDSPNDPWDAPYNPWKYQPTTTSDHTEPVKPTTTTDHTDCVEPTPTTDDSSKGEFTFRSTNYVATTNTDEALSHIGVAKYNPDGSERDFADILGEIALIYPSLSDGEKEYLIVNVFGFTPISSDIRPDHNDTK